MSRTVTFDLDEFQQLLRAELEPIIALLEQKWQSQLRPLPPLPVLKSDFQRNRQAALDIRAAKLVKRQTKTIQEI